MAVDEQAINEWVQDTESGAVGVLDELADGVAYVMVDFQPKTWKPEELFAREEFDPEDLIEVVVKRDLDTGRVTKAIPRSDVETGVRPKKGSLGAAVRDRFDD